MEPLSWRADGSITSSHRGIPDVKFILTQVFPEINSKGSGIMRAKRRSELVMDLYGFLGKPELKKIVGYILRTDDMCVERDLYSDEVFALYRMSKKNVFDAVVLAFFFGQAKGVRTVLRKKGES